MVDRDNRWQDDRYRNDHASRQPGGDRDFYGRDERSEDDYGRGYGEEGSTNYRQRVVGMDQRGNGPGRDDQQRSTYGGRGDYGRGGFGGARDYSREQDRDFGRFSGDLGFGSDRNSGFTQGSSVGGRPDYRAESYGRAPSAYPQNDRGSERGFWDRATDEVSSWFGDDDAERRRNQDARHEGRGPKGYRRSDERIRDDINDRLTDDPYIDASDIEVKVEASEVTLTGTVESRNARRRAEDLAERISGVTHVQNNLRVTSGAESTREERQAQAQKPGLFSSKS
jgi:osmotically-inducible protein OsmY